MKKINIAIDGHSSCGKSTIAKQLAQYFSYTYIDTGAMYRAVCLYCLQKDIMVDSEIDEKRLLRELNQIEVSFRYNIYRNASETFLNGLNVEQDIRSLWVSKNVSKISKIKAVRDAELKLFITASLEERALRRHSELEDVSIEDVIKNLGDRDFDDTTREENPLKKAENAIVIDNTNLSREEQFTLILKYCLEAMQ